MIYEDVGDRLRRAIECRNLSQKQVADMIGISPVSLNRYISGTRRMRDDVIIVICTKLGISSDWLLGLNRR